MKRNTNNIFRSTATLIAFFVIAAGVALAPFTAMADGSFVWPTSGSTATYSSGSKPTVSWPTSGSTATYSQPTGYSYNTYSGGSKPTTGYSYNTYSGGYKPVTSYKTDYSYYPNTYYGYSVGYVPTYYYGGGYGGGYNTNVNNNNNNVNVNVGGGTSTVYHSCAETGQYGTYPNCYTPNTPSCADYGQTGSYPNCHPRDNDNVSCDLSVSDTTVEEGDRVTLEWDTDGNPNYASINQGIGRVDEDGGSERITVDSDTTFRMTVRNASGDEDTCSVTVRVDDENNFSSVSFVGEPTNNPPVVYLSSIPYTGLEDIDPILLSYWLMLIAGAGAGVWVLYTKGMIPTFAFASLGEPTEDTSSEEAPETSSEVAPEVSAFVFALSRGDNETALHYVRESAVNGVGIEEFLTSAETVTTDAELQSRVSSALAQSRVNGIRGVKAVLA